MKYFLTVLFFAVAHITFAQQDYARLVNPFVGTGGHGHTYPGATVPHGMVQLSPDTRLDGWDGCGGYHYSDSFIYGFSHTHLSGTGVSDYGDILLMPGVGIPSSNNKLYGSLFKHSSEKAYAGYYAVTLDKHGIRAELTTTERVGFHHYSFNAGDSAHMILDLKHRDEVIASSLFIEDSVTVTGMRRSKAWADNQYVFFVMKFSKPITGFGIWDDESLLPAGIKEKVNSKNLKAFFQFLPGNTGEVFVKVAISPVDVEGARANLQKELPDWDFRKAVQKATDKWNDELSKIEVSTSDSNKQRIFYTALYHTAIVPTINMDVDGRYRGRDNAIHNVNGYTNYSVFSLWDTYRGAHPLYTITDRSRTLDYIQTFLTQYREGGRLPVWELSGCETDCMIGYHSVSVICDAYIKGIRNFDTKLALTAMRHSATRQVLGLPAYLSKAVIETEDEPESVSKTLEYAYDDWCIATYAQSIGDQAVYNEYIKRAQYYKNVFDPTTGFMRARKNGDWLKPFDPREVNNHFTEANSWQYSFYMPQDIGGYIKTMGGPQRLERQLDSLFTAPTNTTGRNQSDITGLIGQYAHGNEPSHHIAYLYNYTSRPDKTQKIVHQIMTEMYADAPDGLIGNEDCGQMSAWYVLSSLGFYPVTPGSDQYMIGTPLYDSATINLENGAKFKIISNRDQPSAKYVRGLLLSTNNNAGRRKHDSLFIRHQDIANGGRLEFMLSDKAEMSNSNLARLHPPPSITLSPALVSSPVIHGGAIPFKDRKKVAISTSQKGMRIRYTTDGTEPTEKSMLYKQPLTVATSMTIKAIAFDNSGNKSFITTATYNRLPHNWTVTLQTPYEQQYSGGGADALVDELRGSVNWHKGNWQGYQGNGLDAVIDLTTIQDVSEVSLTFLQDTKAWIVMPKTVTVELSVDGKNFTPAYTGTAFLRIDDLNPQIKTVVAKFSSKPIRYLRVRAEQYGKLPSWHEGTGGDTHIFIDEVSIK